MAVKLGDKVKDKYSGFQGTAVLRLEHYMGTRRIAVVSKKLGADGKPIEEYFEEQRLCVTSPAKPRQRVITVELGDKVKDKLTGFTGTAWIRAEYLNGCIQIAVVSAKLGSDGKPIEEYFDEQQLCTTSKAKVGGPRTAPPAMSTPPRRGM